MNSAYEIDVCVKHLFGAEIGFKEPLFRNPRKSVWSSLLGSGPETSLILYMEDLIYV